MTKETAESTAELAFKEKMDKPIKFTYEWTAYESIEEMREANDMLSNDEILKARNAKRQAKARTAANAAALEAGGYKKPTLATSEKLRATTMLETMLASGKYDADSAWPVIETVLGITRAQVEG